MKNERIDELILHYTFTKKYAEFADKNKMSESEKKVLESGINILDDTLTVLEKYKEKNILIDNSEKE